MFEDDFVVLSEGTSTTAVVAFRGLYWQFNSLNKDAV